jgi:TonB family protein
VKTYTPHSIIKGKFSTIVLLIVVIAHFILIYLGWRFQVQEFKSISENNILQVGLISTQANKLTLLRQSEIIKNNSNNTIRSNITAPATTSNAKTDATRNTTNSAQPLHSNNTLTNTSNPNTQTQPQVALNNSVSVNSKNTEGVTHNNSQSTTVNNASGQLNSSNNSNLTSATNPVKIEKPNAFAAHLQNPKPIYPKRSRELGEQGVVVLSIWVDIDGKPDKVQIIKSSGFPRLDDAAQRQISENWRFVPGQKNGQKETMELIQRIPFSLNEATP